METEEHLQKRIRWWAVGLYLLAAALLVVLVWAAGQRYPRSGVDYYFSLYPETRSWLDGEFNPRDTEFFHPPWAIWSLVPFVVLPYPVGLALLRATSILMLLAGVWAFAESRRQWLWGAVLALFNLHAVDLLFRGQMTAFDALGAGLGWYATRRRNPWLMGTSYVLLSLNPPNTIPFALIMLWHTWHKWERREFVHSLVIPLIVGASSFLVFLLWPLDWAINFAHRSLPGPAGADWFTTIWRAAEQLALPSILPWGIVAVVLGVTIWAWRRLAGDATWPEEQRLKAYLMLSTAATFVITPWAASYRYVLLYAMIVPLLVEWSLVVVLGLHALTYLPLLRP
jgi:hypothetical protein